MVPGPLPNTHLWESSFASLMVQLHCTTFHSTSWMSCSPSWSVRLAMKSQNYRQDHLRHVSVDQKQIHQSYTITTCSQVRGPMVYDTNLTLFHHRTLIFPDFLVLPQAMAIVICTKNDAERYVVTFLLGSSRIDLLQTSPRTRHMLTRRFLDGLFQL